VRLDFTWLDEDWNLNILKLIGLFNVLNQTLLILHEVGFVVTLSDAQLTALLDVFIFLYVHNAVALHGCILVFGAANVRLVWH
jgi:hypothetical protein